MFFRFSGFSNYIAVFIEIKGASALGIAAAAEKRPASAAANYHGLAALLAFNIFADLGSFFLLYDNPAVLPREFLGVFAIGIP